jgi:hypothetical protein
MQLHGVKEARVDLTVKVGHERINLLLEIIVEYVDELGVGRHP